MKQCYAECPYIIQLKGDKVTCHPAVAVPTAYDPDPELAEEFTNTWLHTSCQLHGKPVSWNNPEPHIIPVLERPTTPPPAPRKQPFTDTYRPSTKPVPPTLAERLLKSTQVLVRIAGECRQRATMAYVRFLEQQSSWLGMHGRVLHIRYAELYVMQRWTDKARRLEAQARWVQDIYKEATV